MLPPPATSRMTSRRISIVRVTGGEAGNASRTAFRKTSSRASSGRTPIVAGLLYAGTEQGIYYSLDDGRNWSSLQLNLPITPITDLAVKDRDLVAATQGRGYWILDDLTVLHQFDENVPAKAAHLYEPRDAIRLTAGGRSDDPGAAGTNPPVGAVLRYSLGDDLPDDVELSLSVFEARGSEPIWTWTRKLPDGDEEEESGPNAPPDTRVLSADKGLNSFVWDLRYPGMERFDKLIMWADMRQGPRAVPGRYRAELTIGGDRQEVDFEVLADPRSSATQADFESQFEFIAGARDLLSRTHVEIRKIRQLRTQLEGLKTRLQADAESDQSTAALIEEIDLLLETVDPIEKSLYQTQNESRQDPLNYPIRLNNKLTSLMRTVDVGDARPTDGAVAVRDELRDRIESELGQLDSVWSENVPALNSRIQSMGIDIVSIDEE